MTIFIKNIKWLNITISVKALVGIIAFFIGLVVSTVLIYIITKLLGEEEGIKTAFLASILGAIVFGIIHFIFGNGIVASGIGGIIWLIALKKLYNTEWIKAILIVISIWIVMSIITSVLPVFPRPF